MGFFRNTEQNTNSDEGQQSNLILWKLITLDNRLLFLVLTSFIFIFTYSITNRYHLYPPKYLEFSLVDQYVELVPWTIFIYLSEYIYFYVAYLLIQEEDTYNRYAWSLGAVVFISAVFFVFYPTTYPRHLFPIPENINTYVYQAFHFLRSIDDPSNSFPSLHVSACFVTAFVFIKESRIKLFFFLLWSVAISISTLTTKQHYLIDVVAGFFLAVFSGYIFIIKARYKDRREQALPLNIDSWGS